MGLQYVESGILAAFAKLLTVAQVCIAIYAIAALIRRRSIDAFVIFTASACAAMLLSAFYNTDYTGVIYVIVDAIRLVGFACLIKLMVMDDPAALIDGTLILTTVLTIVFLLSALLFLACGGEPGPDTIYAFGGKNSIFMQSIPFFLVACMRSYIKTGKVGIPVIALSTLYAFAAYLIDSMGSAVCFTLLTALLLLFAKPYWRLGIITNGCVCTALLISAFLIVSGFIDIGAMFEPLFSLIGRSPTFSGRMTVWSEALAYFADSPVFGAGPRIVFHLVSMKEGVVETSAAHSFFLDGMARYGLLYFLTISAGIVGLFLFSYSRRKQPSINSITGIVFILLLHSMFDSLNEYVFIFALASLYYFTLEFKDYKLEN